MESAVGKGRFRSASWFLLQLLLCITLALTTGLSSQTASTGALIGEVLDPSGSGIAQASVEARNQGMTVSRTTVSDENGRFVLPPLALF